MHTYTHIRHVRSDMWVMVRVGFMGHPLHTLAYEQPTKGKFQKDESMYKYTYIYICIYIYINWLFSQRKGYLSNMTIYVIIFCRKKLQFQDHPISSNCVSSSYYWKWNFSMDPHVRLLVGRSLVGWMVCPANISLKKQGK